VSIDVAHIKPEGTLQPCFARQLFGDPRMPSLQIWKCFLAKNTRTNFITIVTTTLGSLMHVNRTK